MAAISKMSEGGNEPQEDPISEELNQPDREHQQVVRNHDIRGIRSNHARRQAEYAAWPRASFNERLNPYTSEQGSDFDLYSVRESIGSGRGRIPLPPTGPPPPYPYDEEVERSRGLSRGSNSNGESPARRFWNRLRRPERRVPPVDNVPRLTEQQGRATSDAREPPPYSLFEPSGQNHGDDDSDFDQIVELVRPGLTFGDDRTFDEFCRLMRAGRRQESDQPAPAQNLADNDNDVDISQYFQLVSSEQHPESIQSQPGASAIEDLQGDPELPPYSPSEEYEGQLEVDPWDGQNPWEFYLAAIEAAQNPPEGQPRTFPDVWEVHLEWLRTIERNRAPVNRAAP
ncbi:hypothetical protein IFM61606_04119 [Aspergillus udagawae]|uniref:Uncharacterized protein n=1 Tax=Aspergillus udagawae TaxID=91492 RepID=A0ABQ1A2V2_9EURO|nr:hypothetical protein IFM51744_03799 [Aspergillus udagawae]GFF72213.1 hypothetical protein IFM53868_00758 [Aspergillus udagawae]GFG04440.1 hypothetical protein IFM5058_01929 [Aspergillus udagawae]GFG24217.1 hypothetical protein IFM61606_04119 [Aspergillus udagawae]